MQPTGPITPNLSQLLGVRPSGGEAPRLQLGQTLLAQVVKTGAPGQATLRIGQQLVQAQTGQLKLTPGETLQLQVAQLGKLPLLRVVAQVQQNIITQAIRQTLPQQQPLPQTLATLAQTLGNSAARQLPPQVLQLAREVINRLPDSARVSTPEGLKQSLKDSGTFLEAKLTQSSPSSQTQQTTVQNDLKANLLRLAQAIRQQIAAGQPKPSGTTARTPSATPAPTGVPSPTTTSQTPGALLQTGLPGAGREADIIAAMRRQYPPRPQPSVAMRARANAPLLRMPELLAHVEAAVARIKLNQLASTPTPDRPQFAEWLIELPVRTGNDMLDMWALRIARDSSQRNADGSEGLPQWTVTLAFDLPGLGPMQSRVTLQGEDKLTALFMSETSGILPLVNEHLPLLQARLEQVGLQVDNLACHHGTLPTPTRKPGERDGILDEKA